jgi:hypothetical protein
MKDKTGSTMLPQAIAGSLRRLRTSRSNTCLAAGYYSTAGLARMRVGARAGRCLGFDCGCPGYVDHSLLEQPRVLDRDADLPSQASSRRASVYESNAIRSSITILL